MKTSLLAAMMLALGASAMTTTFAVAAEDSSLSAKAMKDLPGTKGGSTTDPTAKPMSGSLSEKAMQDQPGVNSDKTGKTANPTAKPDSGSLADKAMKDNPGVNAH